MSVFSTLAERARAGEPTALATVVRTEGSSPAEPAMKMAVGPDGRLAGTVGGGRVEATVEQAARDILAGKPATILQFTLDDDMADEGGMICGGTVHILVEPLQLPAPWLDEIGRATDQGRRAALVARVGDTVSRELLFGEQADPYLDNEEPHWRDDVFVEPIVHPRCIILGSGHVGLAVAQVAKAAGLAVTAVDDRPDHAARIAKVADHTEHGDLVEGLGRVDAGPDDFLVVMTRGHGLDLTCVRAALQTPARYVGMLASRKKAKTIREALDAEGTATERLHAPIGLDLGATSAREIAVSVVAQLVKVRRLGRGDR